MNPALFNKRITFQTPPDPDVTNENAFPVGDWTDVKTVWAMVKTPNDKSSTTEFYEAASTYAKSTLSFIIRYTPDITSKMRIKYRERLYEIAAPPINDNERDKTLTIVGREIN